MPFGAGFCKSSDSWPTVSGHSYSRELNHSFGYYTGIYLYSELWPLTIDLLFQDLQRHAIFRNDNWPSITEYTSTKRTTSRCARTLAPCTTWAPCLVIWRLPSIRCCTPRAREPCATRGEPSVEVCGVAVSVDILFVFISIWCQVYFDMIFMCISIWYSCVFLYDIHVYLYDIHVYLDIVSRYAISVYAYLHIYNRYIAYEYKYIRSGGLKCACAA